MEATQTINGASTMEQVIEVYPGARRALFRRYHIGGCSSCGFSPTDALESVLRSHGVEDVAEAVEYIKQSEELDRKIQIQPKELEAALQSPEPPRLLDIRTPEEHFYAKIEGGRLVDQELFREVMDTWPKDAPIVTYCHVGERSLEAASYLIGHGFTNVRTLAGGIDAWAEHVDPKIPRY